MVCCLTMHVHYMFVIILFYSFPSCLTENFAFFENPKLFIRNAIVSENHSSMGMTIEVQLFVEVTTSL